MNTLVNTLNNRITELLNTIPEDTAHELEIGDEVAIHIADRNRLIELDQVQVQADTPENAVTDFLADFKVGDRS